MQHRLSLVLVSAAALAVTPGCFITRAIGLGPDPVAEAGSADAHYEEAQRLYSSQQWKQAADAFHRVWADYPKSPLASDAQFYEAESRYGQGKYNGAFELYKVYLRDWPLSPHTPTIQKRIYDLGVYTIEAGQHGFLGIFDYASEGIDELDYLVSAFPHGDLADDALIYMADFEYKNHQPNEAIDHLHDLIDNFPASEWVLEGRFRLAKAYRELNRGSKYDADALQRARAEYRTYIELVTSDTARQGEYADQLAEARDNLGEIDEELATKKLDAARFYLKAGNTSAARAELVNVVRDFPRTRAAGEARSQLGLDAVTVTDGGGAGAGGTGGEK